MKNNKRRKFNTKPKRWNEPSGKIIDTTEMFSGKGQEMKPAFELTDFQKKQKNKKVFKCILSVILAFVVIGVGYTGMDVYMTRHAKPAEELIKSKTNKGSFSEISLDFSAKLVENVTFDNSTMLSAVITNVQTAGCNSICFNAKRDDGTIGYQSNLATIDTINAMSNYGSDTKGSIARLSENDILPVARICCYKDNILPLQDENLAIKKGKNLYADSQGNTYLNPNEQIVYEYIADIVRELYGYGVKVFVLYGYDLPEDISDKYDDGFDSLATRLSKELNADIKILKEVDVSIRGYDAETGKIKNSAIEKEAQKLEPLETNQIYYVSTSIDEARVVAPLVQNGVGRFIIGE